MLNDSFSRIDALISLRELSVALQSPEGKTIVAAERKEWGGLCKRAAKATRRTAQLQEWNHVFPHSNPTISRQMVEAQAKTEAAMDVVEKTLEAKCAAFDEGVLAVINSMRGAWGSPLADALNEMVRTVAITKPINPYRKE